MTTFTTEDRKDAEKAFQKSMEDSTSLEPEIAIKTTDQSGFGQTPMQITEAGDQ